MERIIKLSFAELKLNTEWLGKDLVITLSGGVPHIGCAVLAVPRPSLFDSEKNSCTSSVLNVTGHKDEVICRLLAEKACKKYGVTVMATGGFHIDAITEEQIRELMDLIQELEL